MSETDLENEFADWVAARGGMTYRLQIINCRGWPDRTVLLPDGLICFVEFKRPDGRGVLSPQQSDQIKLLRRMGFPCLVTNDLEEAKRFIMEVTHGVGESDYQP